ncbi:M56 family metallopeptidase [Gulosibacter faecalis]|jgi:Zn-dependent protease with chaperone function|uniref:M56 family metallopeptidase n=1 Tax=Gulosibacter faecalis TaxID=272240 RepID=A0ABW5UYZ1_9MICO|nr:M56 family metallopeptidase [Gulosibacter faecalis]
MIPGLVALLLASVLLIVAPKLLARGTWQVLHPVRALVLWFASFAVGNLLAGCAIVFAVSDALNPPEHPVVTAEFDAVVSFATPVLALVVVVGTIFTVTREAEPVLEGERELIDEFRSHAVGVDRRRGVTLVRIDTPRPFACAVPGTTTHGQAEIFYSTGLEEILTRPQLQAVLAHEYAHLKQGHGWLVRIAETNARTLPHWLAASTGLQRATRLFTELAADDAAGTQAGAANLANALVRMAAATNDPIAEVRAERLTRRRWPRPSAERVPEPIRLGVTDDA